LAKESGIISTDQLRVTDAQGKPVPAQFRVLSRWGRLEDAKAPIRWVLVDFQADVPPRGTATYRLQQGPPAPLPAGIEVSDKDAAVEVVTGPIAARIPKQGVGFLEQLWMINAGDTRGAGGAPRQALLSDRVSLRVEKVGGPFRSLISKTVGVTIEEAGPLRTVVRMRGTFQAPDGKPWMGGDARPVAKDGRPGSEGRPLEFDARISFYADKSYVKLTITLENNGNSLSTYHPVNDTFFDGLYLDVPWQMGAVRRVAFPEHDETTAPGGRWVLSQTHAVRDPMDESKNFDRQLARNGKIVKSGQRSDGWASLCDDTRCGGVGVRAFWQNYPKSLESSETGAAIGLWPLGVTSGEVGEYGRGGYFFSGGWHKTHEVFLAFWPQGGRNPLAEGGLLTTPLLLLAPPSWYADTRAWGLIAPAGFRSLDAASREAVERYERFRAVLVDPEVSSDGVTLERLRETRGLAAPQAPGFHFNLDLYGLETFGEIPWGGNRVGTYSALHYDWSYIMWLHLIRSGDFRYLPLALEMTDHSADLDQIHNKPTQNPNVLDGVWWWEQLRDGKGHHRSTQGAGLIISHTWNGGYALGYLLTGNPRYREAAEAGAKAGRRYWFENRKVSQAPVAFDQTRSQGWTILMLVNLYRIDGDVEHLRDALTIFANSLLHTEQLDTVPGSGGKGYITIGQYKDKSYIGKAVITFLTYPLEPLSELHYEASSAGLDGRALEAYLIRSLDWLKNFAYVGGVTDQAGQYSPLTLSYSTDPNDRSKNTGGAYQHNIHVAGGFAYGYMMLKDKDSQKAKEYLDFARRLFRDLMFYRETGNLSRDKFVDPDKRGPIRLGWPGTFTKELGWISRSGQLYLHAEYLLSKGSGVN